MPYGTHRILNNFENKISCVYKSVGSVGLVNHETVPRRFGSCHKYRGGRCFPELSLRVLSDVLAFE